MAQPDLLDHDSSAYREVLDRINALSTGWNAALRTGEPRLAPLMEIWHELNDDERGRALPRAMVAHLVADLQDDPREELRWDLQSLRALAPIWEQVEDPRLFEAGRRCLPSIYLSLAVASRKCGNPAGAREYLRRSRTLLPILPASAYRDQLAAAVDRLDRVLLRQNPS